MRKHIIIIYGPTGVGKSDYAINLAQDFPIEIINGDVGQLYTPFSIGTAKPNWKEEKAPHHLFDVISEPQDFTVVQFRKKVLELCEQIWLRGATPVVVGGSGFYLKSLFFPPLPDSKNMQTVKELDFFKGSSTAELYTQLQAADSHRSSQIHPHDRYRIERALLLAENNAGAVHNLRPLYQDLGFPYLFIHFCRERADLYDRINRRTTQMLKQGWIEEVQALQNTPWQDFLQRKKLIGYDDIFSFLQSNQGIKDLEQQIAQKTRRYAKRQMTFWRMLEKKLTTHCITPSAIENFLITDETKTYVSVRDKVKTFLDSLQGKKI